MEQEDEISPSDELVYFRHTDRTIDVLAHESCKLLDVCLAIRLVGAQEHPVSVN